LVEHGCAAIPEPPLGSAGYPRVLAAERRPYATTDGWVAVLPYSASNYNDLFREGGRLDLIDDPRVLSASARAVNAGDLYALIDPIIATRSSAFWIEYCSRHDIPAGPVRSLDDLVAELPIEQHPTMGAYRQIPPPVRFSSTPAGVRRHAPMLGEHGREVLREVGLSDQEVDALVGDPSTAV
jgi:crotonobetainyl-CoA:carnitine CoA-transferase CaiB-like acyl-CoA transferase